MAPLGGAAGPHKQEMLREGSLFRSWMKVLKTFLQSVQRALASLGCPLLKMAGNNDPFFPVSALGTQRAGRGGKCPVAAWITIS